MGGSMFDESEKKLLERAAYIENIDGTVKREYTTDPDDASDMNKGNIKMFFGAIAFLLVAEVGLLVYGIIYNDSLIIGLSSGFFVVLLFLTLFFFYLLRISKKNVKVVYLDEVKLAFNSYGLTMRVCGALSHCVYAYAWTDFENISENKRSLVGIRQGKAYIFPKRVMTEEEFNKFRRFSFAALGTKCLYKNFKF